MIISHKVYCFPRAAIVKNHKLDGFKQQKIICTVKQASSSKSRCQKDYRTPSKALGENPLPFPGLMAPGILRLVAIYFQSSASLRHGLFVIYVFCSFLFSFLPFLFCFIFLFLSSFLPFFLFYSSYLIRTPVTRFFFLWLICYIDRPFEQPFFFFVQI